MTDLAILLKRAIELLMPEVRHYYKVVRKGKITKSYCQDGGYYADVQPLRNDDSADESEPLLSKVELPVIWGGAKRGVICLPAKDSLCDIEYYNGDPNFPRISNIRFKGNKAPATETDEFLIQQEDGGTTIKICADGSIEVFSKKPIKIENKDDIEFKSEGTVKIVSDKVNLINQSGINLGAENPSEYVALATKVKTELTKIQTEFQTLQTLWVAHTHPTGVGPSGPPTAPYVRQYSASDVAASVTKAK